MHVARGGVSHRQSLLRHAQPKTEIPIDYHQRPAGSFLGDFRTPRGARNSSRNRNGGFGVDNGEKQIFMDRHRGRLLTAIRSDGWVAEFG